MCVATIMSRVGVAIGVIAVLGSFMVNPLVVLASSPPVAVQPTEVEAEAFVVDISNQVLSILEDKASDESVREEKLTTLFNAYVDTRWMAYFVIGRYRKQMSDEQLSKYLNLYHDYLVGSYVPDFKKYDGQAIEVLRVQKESKREYTVQIAVQQSDKPSVRVDYRIRTTKNGAFKIIDIVGESVSLITTQRSDFAGLISRKGVDYFLEKLESKVSSMAEGKV